VLALSSGVALLLALSLAVTASADPGTPGVDQASSAVYPPGCKTADKCPTVDEHTNQVLGVAESGNNDSGGPGAPPSAVLEASGGGSSLPFTGLSAPVLLAISLLLVGLGLGVRRFAPKNSPSGS
jgi:hypothetical protein